jgi:hypothetical protein
MAPSAAPTPSTLYETPSSLSARGPNTNLAEHFSEAFIASFLDTLVNEASAAGCSGMATSREEYGGAEASLLNGGWPPQVDDEGAEGTKEGDAFDIGSIFPAAQQW